MNNNPDLWKHRSSGMKCETCMFFVLKVDSDDRPTRLGRCRRHAPTMNGFVPVFTSDFCGDHRLDENKLLSPMQTEPSCPACGNAGPGHSACSGERSLNGCNEHTPPAALLDEIPVDDFGTETALGVKSSVQHNSHPNHRA